MHVRAQNIGSGTRRTEGGRGVMELCAYCKLDTGGNHELICPLHPVLGEPYARMPATPQTVCHSCNRLREELRHARYVLSLSGKDYEACHHPKKYQHPNDPNCPVEKLIRDVLEGSDVRQTNGVGR